LFFVFVFVFVCFFGIWNLEHFFGKKMATDFFIEIEERQKKNRSFSESKQKKIKENTCGWAYHPKKQC
jgi:hypothetical protein